ncbi:unnamed protein product [Owenia fusiformis]|uniref:Uncharacterized protein n=1 Tax=Owenia fusiformis TaxID=6347 RepID=A0A8J1XSQ5_OWEFU|nr:unnamed protein product [Owenia fusiformis]
MDRHMLIFVLVVCTILSGCYARSKPGPVRPRNHCLRSNGATSGLGEKWTSERDGVKENCECVPLAKTFDNPSYLPEDMWNTPVKVCLLEGCERQEEAYKLGTVITTRQGPCTMREECVAGTDPFGPMDTFAPQFYFKIIAFSCDYAE